MPIPDTYYTRPMPPPGSKPLAIDRLCRDGAEVDFDLPLAALPRLDSRIERTGGSVRGAVRFGRQSGIAVADLSLQGEAMLRCQRCMQPMRWPVRSTVRVALVASAAEAGALPEELEPVLAPDGRIRIADLVEEELLLTLPIVPLHESADCAAPGEPSGPQAADEPAAARPFARLGELLSHK